MFRITEHRFFIGAKLQFLFFDLLMLVETAQISSHDNSTLLVAAHADAATARENSPFSRTVPDGRQIFRSFCLFLFHISRLSPDKSRVYDPNHSRIRCSHRGDRREAG